MQHAPPKTIQGVRRRIAVVVLALFLDGASNATAQAEASSQASTAPVANAKTTAHLQGAVHWAHAKRYPFAIEHLRRLDPRTLDAREAATYAQLLAHIASRSPRAYGLETLVRHCTLEALHRLPSCAEARARWLTAQGEVGAALVIWQTRYDRLRNDPQARKKLVRGALFFLGRAGAAAFQRDLAVQRGALWRFLGRISDDIALRDDAEIMLAVAKLALRLGPEDERTDAAVERAVVADAADPRALALRGDLERTRGYLDRALPWYVWAAYTSSAHQHEDFSEHWSKLSSVYRAIGWHQHAVEAADRASEPRREPFPEATAAESPYRATCRAWHDWLIAYRPEALVRAHGVAWSDTIEDLEVWHKQCALAPRVPFCADPQFAGPRAPLRALLYLREQWQERSANRQHAETIGKSLLCVVQQTVVLTPPVVEAVDGRSSFPANGSFERAHARALVQLRTGRLGDALTTWTRTFPVGWHLVDPEHPPSRAAKPSAEIGHLETIFAALARSPKAQLCSDRDAVTEFIERWHARIETDPHAGRLAIARARVERRRAPDDARTRQAAEQAVVLSAGEAEALALLGRLELEAGRPDRALPWLIWALDSAERRPVPSPELIATYTALGWWQQADTLMREGTPKPDSELATAHTLGPSLPAGCQRRARRLAALELRNAIAQHGIGWQNAIRPYRDWMSACTIAAPPIEVRDGRPDPLGGP